jgi:hypothetical protein
MAITGRPLGTIGTKNGAKPENCWSAAAVSSEQPYPVDTVGQAGLGEQVGLPRGALLVGGHPRALASYGEIAPGSGNRGAILAVELDVVRVGPTG